MIKFVLTALLHQLGYSLALVLPLSTFSFFITGQHDLWVAMAWTLPFWLVLLADWISHDANPDRHSKVSKKVYDLVLYALAVIQIVNVSLMLNYISQMSWQTQGDYVNGIVNLIVIRFLSGTSSGTSGIVVAHELTHRPQFHMRLLGRILLCTVCYEHFVIAHQRGHHANMKMPDDIATARLGESFNHYWQRVSLGHLRFAWRSEQNRLPSPLDNKVLQGLLIELSLLTAIFIHFGWLAAVMFLYQALAAVRILEAVNYFQHWGLSDDRYNRSYGWVNDSPVSRYALIGLSHHIGHHEDENKQYHEISYSKQGPKMPYGYFVMNFWVKIFNKSYQQMAYRQLNLYFKQP